MHLVVQRHQDEDGLGGNVGGIQLPKAHARAAHAGMSLGTNRSYIYIYMAELFTAERTFRGVFGVFLCG